MGENKGFTIVGLNSTDEVVVMTGKFDTSDEAEKFLNDNRESFDFYATTEVRPLG